MVNKIITIWSQSDWSGSSITSFLILKVIDVPCALLAVLELPPSTSQHTNNGTCPNFQIQCHGTWCQ